MYIKYIHSAALACGLIFTLYDMSIFVHSDIL